MVDFRNIEVREAILNCHEVLAPNSLDLKLFRQDKINGI